MDTNEHEFGTEEATTDCTDDTDVQNKDGEALPTKYTKRHERIRLPPFASIAVPCPIVLSVNGADGIRDVEGKAARVAASSRGKLASFKSVVTFCARAPQAAPAGGGLPLLPRSID